MFNSVYSPDGLRPIPIAIVDEDRSDYSGIIVERLKKEKSIKLVETTREKAEKQVAMNMVEAAFVITPDFKEKIIKEDVNGIIKILKNPSSIAAEMIGETIAGTTMRLLCNAAASNIVVKEYSSLVYSTSKSSQEVWNEAWKHTDDQWNQSKPLMKIDIQDINGSIANINHLVAQNFRILWGVTAAFLMFFLLIGAWWLADEKINGTIIRLLSSTVTPLSLVMANIIFLFIIGIVLSGVLLVIIRYILGISHVPLIPVFLILSSYIFFVSALVLTISVYLSPIQLNFFIPVFSLFTAIIGGCFWNIDVLSDKITKLSLITPQGWAIKALNSVTIEGSKLDFILWVVFGFSLLSAILMFISYRKIERST